MSRLSALDRKINALRMMLAVSIALLGVAAVGGLDFLTGYELSFSLFYLAPVSFASWYINRTTGVVIALLPCLSWYTADQISGHIYSNFAIPVWNALVRLGYFLITGLLLSSLRRILSEQARLARTDALTGLYARRSFDDRLVHDLALIKRSARPLTLAYIDLDNFKQVNDTRRHHTGDQLLQTVGTILQESVRGSDTPARLGGDEFALILPDTDAKEARDVMGKIRQQLALALEQGGWGVTCSIGVITATGVALTPHQVLQAADELMYRVKLASKDAMEFRVMDADRD